MKLLRTKEADDFIQMVYTPEQLAAERLPEGEYPIRTAAFDALLASGEPISTQQLIYGLMDWLDVTDDPLPTLIMLHRILKEHIPPEPKPSARCVFETETGLQHSFYVGEVDVIDPVIAWHRHRWVAAVANRHAEEPNRIVVSAPAPISVRTAQSIFHHSAPVDMGEPLDSFASLVMSSGRTGAYYAWEACELTPIAWEYGLGQTMREEGMTHDPDYKLRGPGLAPNQLVRLIAIGNGFET